MEETINYIINILPSITAVLTALVTAIVTIKNVARSKDEEAKDLRSQNQKLLRENAMTRLSVDELAKKVERLTKAISKIED